MRAGSMAASCSAFQTKAALGNRSTHSRVRVALVQALAGVARVFRIGHGAGQEAAAAAAEGDFQAVAVRELDELAGDVHGTESELLFAGMSVSASQPRSAETA